MASQPLLSIIVPAYNESRRIGKTLREISRFFAPKGWSYEIIVVDDGSSDSTRETVEKLNLPHLRVVDYGGNRGKGFAVNFGVKNSRGEWILFTDADNSTPIGQFDKLWLETDRYQVIIGSRYTQGSQISIKQSSARVVLGRLGNLLIQALILPGIKDTQCGFKLFHRPVAEKIFPLQTVWRWGFDMEILRIAKEQGLKIAEVPITWLNDEDSKLQTRRVFVKTLLELLSIKKNSLLGRYRPGRGNDVSLFLRFAAIGVVGTVLDFTVLNVTHLSFGLELRWALTLGFLSGAINNYLMNSFWSFRHPLSWGRWGRFLAVALIGLIFNNLIVLALVGWGWNYNFAKLLALSLVFFWNFFANKAWTFNR